MSLALITGATAGIGKATAEIFAKNNWDLILTGRRNQRLQDLKNELEVAHSIKVHCLCFDVSKPKQVRAHLENLEIMKGIDLLVNNAGLALGVGSISDGSFEDWDVMIDTNIKGLLYITRMVSPHMIARGEGHIINLSSIAGKEVYKGGNVYCATKFAVDALNKAMRLELLKSNIRVTSINPGKVETEFSEVRYRGDKEKAKSIYSKFTPLYAEDIAEVIYFAAQRPLHVNLNEIIITPTGQANAFYDLTNV